VVVTENVDGTSYTVSTSSLTGGTYTWSVQAVQVVPANYALGSTTISTAYASTFSFEFCNPNVAPSTPSLTSPSNGQAYYSTISLTQISLNWIESSFGYSCLTSTSSFLVSYSQNSALSSGVTTSTISGNTFSMTAQFAPGTWYWMVTASNGALTTSSSIDSFSICLLTSPTSFNLLTPPDNANGISYDDILFSWSPSSPTAACVTSNITYTVYLALAGDSYFVNYTTSSTTNYTTSLPHGSYFWYVTATDSHGTTTQSPTFSFVTTISSCDNVAPKGTTLSTPTYSVNPSDNTQLQSLLQWSSPDFGISCNITNSASVAVIIYDSNNQIYLTQTLSSTTQTPLTVILPPGTYTWVVNVTNVGGVSTISAPGTIDVCDLIQFLGFLSEISPANNSLSVANSISEISWKFSGPQPSCYGASMTYSFSIQGPAGSQYLALPNQNITSFSVVNYGDGTYSYTFTSDISSIPISGLSTVSYSGIINFCTPGFSIPPVLESPIMFAQLSQSSSSVFTWVQNQTSVDSCSRFLNEGLLEENFVESLYTSQSVEFTVETLQCSSYPSSNTEYDFGCSVSNLPVGSGFWKVISTKEIWIGSGSILNSTTTSEIFTYSVCANQPPPTTQLVAPQYGSIFQRCNISTELTWDPYYETDFGVVCEGISQNSLTVQISQDPNFGTTDQSIEAVVLAGSTLLSFSDLQPLTIYFWRLNASNGILFTFSNVFNFTTPDLNTPACSGNGYCSFGQCVCNADYVGLQCQSLNGSNTITPSGTAAFNPDSNPSSGGEIAGIVIAACLIVLVVLAIVLFLFARKKHESLMSANDKRAVPDFGKLGYAVNGPNRYDPKKVSWKAFEELLGSSQAFQLVMLENIASFDLDDVTKHLVYVSDAHKTSKS